MEYFTKLSPQDFETIESNKTPVILVAGMRSSGRMLLPLKEFLESKGYPTYLPPEKKNLDHLPKLAKRLIKQVQKIQKPKVQIVAHSLGGLITLKAMQDPEFAEKVERVIALGSPFRGSLLGVFALHDNNRKFVRYLSEETDELTSHKAINHKFISLFAEYDEVVIPQKCATLRYAKENAEIPIIGHFNLIVDPKAFKEIAKRLV